MVDFLVGAFTEVGLQDVRGYETLTAARPSAGTSRAARITDSPAVLPPRRAASAGRVGVGDAIWA
jgi:hypothetical protein